MTNATKSAASISTESLTAWETSAAAAGDTETMLIAKIALGQDVDSASYAEVISADKLASIASMSRDEARTVAAGWSTGD